MQSSINTAPIKQAFVLAGGLGTRLGELTRTTPKPLLPVSGRPFISYQIAWLARHGIEDVVVSTGYLGDAFKAYLSSNTFTGPYGNVVRVRQLQEAAPSGTGGALKVHEDELADRFLLINGDSLFDCNLAEILNVGQRLTHGEALLTVRKVDDTTRYGRVRMKGTCVVGFDEKSSNGPGNINAGVTVLSHETVKRFCRVPCSIEKECYPALAAEGLLQAIVQDGYFIDIGTPDAYERAQTEMQAALRKPALFLDRDGVVNPDIGYLHRIEDFAWLPGVIEGIEIARKAGFLVVVVTNQAGVARGLYDEAAVERLHRHINDELRAQSKCKGAWVDAFYYCPYHPDGTVDRYAKVHPDRKPAPGMLLRAIADLGIDASRSILIGDQISDLRAAAAAGIKSHLIGSERVDTIVRRQLDRL